MVKPFELLLGFLLETDIFVASFSSLESLSDNMIQKFLEKGLTYQVSILCK